MALPELLVPAGDFERLQFAVQYGADAVYLGTEHYGMRAGAANFKLENLAKAFETAHKSGVRVYLTCNTLPRNDEMDNLPEFLREIGKCGVDAVIASDIGVLSLIKKILPDMEIHISTQAGVVNYQTAAAFYEMGAKRVVLARELTLEEIKTIRDKTPQELEIEVFVHGAMCVSFSGRCLLSDYFVGRDANRGECAQPCRWGYHLVEEKRLNEPYIIEEDEKGTYILNAKDLCMIEHIKELADAGISSFKIEGRAKSFYYAAIITNAYRQAMDDYAKGRPMSKWLKEEVQKVSHREYCTGFFFGKPDNAQYYDGSGYIREFDVTAVVESSQDKNLNCEQRNKFNKGDELELVSPGKPPVQLNVNRIFDIDGNEIQTANKAMMKCAVDYTVVNHAGEVTPVAGSILRKAVI